MLLARPRRRSHDARMMCFQMQELKKKQLEPTKTPLNTDNHNPMLRCFQMQELKQKQLDNMLNEIHEARMATRGFQQLSHV